MKDILFKVLMLKGDAGNPTDEQTLAGVTEYMQAHPEAAIDETIINSAVDDWLDNHPEATTTVQDGSLTDAKFSNVLKLQTIKDYVTPEMYGAVGDGVTDDSNAIVSAISSGKPVILTQNYLISYTIEISGNTIFKCFGTIIYGGDRDKPAIKLTGQYNDVSINILVDVLSYAAANYDGGWHGWTNDDYAGVTLENSRYSKINVNKIVNFTCGIKITSNSIAGNFNNVISGKQLFNCKYGVYFLTSDTGWMNGDTISDFLISTGSKNTDIDTNSQAITTYGIYQAVSNNTYGIKYTEIINLDFEIMTKSTFIGFYFTFASNNRIKDIVSEIKNDAIFAKFDMYYTVPPVTTRLQQSNDNIFIDCYAMGGNIDIKFANLNPSILSIKEIARHDDTEWYDCFYDDNFAGKAINIDNNNHSSVKGYSFTLLEYDGSLSGCKAARTNYAKVYNDASNGQIRMGTGYPISLLIPVEQFETYHIILNGIPSADSNRPNCHIKLFDSNGDFIAIPDDNANKGICGYFNRAPSVKCFGSLAGALNDFQMSIVDGNIAYVVLMIYGSIKSIQIKKADTKGIVQRHWGDLAFVNYLGNDKFISSSKPSSSANTETAFVGQKVYKADDASHIGQFWELTANGWT